jgi:hypothetical protein
MLSITGHRFRVILLGSLILAACVPPQAENSAIPEADGSLGPSIAVSATAGAESSRSDPGSVNSDLGSLSDSEAGRLMADLLQGTPETQEAALRRIQGANDTRFIAVLIELLRAAQIGLIPSGRAVENLRALEALSGQSFGFEWPDWVTWYGASDLTPPPGFTGWKGGLLSGIDPGFGEFLRDGLPSRIRVEEIQWGGVVVDGIPALDNPAMVVADKAGYLEPGDPVFGISVNEDSRAYPLRIMDWHEMANDVIGGVPVSLAYCTLCGAGIAYDGRGPDGRPYTFGSSGFLFRSNKLMYDRQTRSLWNQLTGEPVLGVLADESDGEVVRLRLLPVVLTTWAEWQDQHPDTLVLDVNTGYNRPYTPGAAYGDYFSQADTMFPVWQRSDLLEDKARIYALQIGGVPKAYPLDLLAEAMVVNDTLAGMPVVLVASRGVVEVQGENRRVGAVVYESGGEVRAYSRGSRVFSPGPDPDSVLDEEGRLWQVGEEALSGPAGESAPRLNGHLAYWFGWFAFFPNTLVYGAE